MDTKDLESRSVAGAAAGNLTVPGVKVGDRLLYVQPTGVASANLASQFTITADDTINNTGGTSTLGQFVIVTWEQLGGGRAFGQSDSGNLGRLPY
jgi:hypothetical protein